jgi:hypothetical protein
MTKILVENNDFFQPKDTSKEKSARHNPNQPTKNTFSDISKLIADSYAEDLRKSNARLSL